MPKVPLRAALAASSALLLSACASVQMPSPLAWLGPDRAELDIRPLETASEAASMAPADRLYRSAVAAIEARDYGLALERLQMARQRAPDDVRVLNAMAVTYDKLGRFDLSARFYAEAQAAAPGSPVVMANLAYSHLMQRQYDELRMASTTPEPAARPYAELMRPAPKMLKPARASGPELKTATPELVGRPLLLVDAGGGASLVRTRLAGLGWSVASPIQRTDQVKDSRILYAAAHEKVALALARTLPFQTAMTVCQDNCKGVVLLLGENATWTG